jgi:hypothetical protein
MFVLMITILNNTSLYKILKSPTVKLTGGKNVL